MRKMSIVLAHGICGESVLVLELSSFNKYMAKKPSNILFYNL